MVSGTERFDMILTRRFDAPKARVWRAWTNADEVMRWWGPEGFTSPMCRMGFRERGTTLVSMRSEQGLEFYNTWTYTSIEPMDRIGFIHGFADEHGNRVAPADIGLLPTIPEEVPHLVTFRAIHDAATELTVHEFGYPDEQIVEVSRMGMEQCLDKMASGLTTA
jgi:uncharacterized protein YndB with AHSA1/START domain